MVTDIDKANEEFWNELCGSQAARALGIQDHSIQSLNKFDNWYLDFYPYLLKHVRVDEMNHKKVLEIGLGYGTLGQKIVEAGADYLGLDIAPGPVKMMNQRLQMQGLSGKAIQGNILNSGLPSESFDYIVSIGCFHHTGDVQKCIDETYRLLKPGGTAFIMVYNQFSYRQWLRWPVKTFLALLGEMGCYRKNPPVNTEQRGAYDTNSRGVSAPETVFLSVKTLRRMFKRHSRFNFTKENCDDLGYKRLIFLPRKKMLSFIGKTAGLDIYIEARKQRSGVL